MDALNPTLAQLLRVCRMDRTWVSAQGVSLWDEAGRRFIDLYSQYGAVSLGHNHPAIVAAITSALAESSPTMVQPYRAPDAVALAEELKRLSPGNLGRCVFATSGAHAVEIAMKLVRSKTCRPLILSARGSFHGKTLGALSVTGQRQYAEGFGPLPRGVEHIPYGDADALERSLNDKRDRIAAFIVEPIQGERGVIEPPPGYLTRVSQLCREHGVALVVDEIQTGLGRTGRLFACEHEQIEPDILLLAKALGGGMFPLGACLVSESWWDERFALLHSSTFANNNLACKVGVAVLNQLTRGGLCEAAARRGQHLHARLERLAALFPKTIRQVRGRGLLAAVELNPITADRSCFLAYLHLQGLYSYTIAGTIAELASVLMLPTLGKRPVLRIAPPLVITEAELDEAMDAVEDAFDRLEKNAARTVADGLAMTERPLEHTPVILPPSRPRKLPQADFAFLIHYTRVEDVAVMDPGLGHLSAGELRRFCDFAGRFPAGLLMQSPVVRSATGDTTRGYLLTVPMLPEQMGDHGRRRVGQEIRKAVDLAAALGAKVIGLGGYTTPYSRRGQAVVGRGIHVTTGNALTAGAAAVVLQQAAEAQGLELADCTVGVVGAVGSVGKLCARWFARRHPRKLVLIGNPRSGANALALLAEELATGKGRIETSTDIAALAECDLVLSASGALEPILERAPLQRNSIICDVAKPPDVSDRLRRRRDLTILDGGLMALPDETLRFGAGNLLGLPDGVQLACLSETILLALEGVDRDHGIGDDVSLSEVDAMLALAARHGFRPVSLSKPPAAAEQEPIEPTGPGAEWIRLPPAAAEIPS